MTVQKHLGKTHRFGQSAGQIVVEYVLLLSIAVTIGMVIVSLLVKRDPTAPENSGALIQRWRGIQETIGKDVQN